MTLNNRSRRDNRVDFGLVFQLSPGMCLILDPGFTILAQNAEHAVATLSNGKNVIGKNLFAAFPDNPNQCGADGISNVRPSLLKVLKTGQPDAMPVVRYDVKAVRGSYEERYWQITNTPILGEDGCVRWIINRAADVTELVGLRDKAEMKS